MKNSSAFSIATSLKHLLEVCQVYIFIPPKVHKSTPSLTPDPVMNHDEMIHILTQAGYLVHKSNPNM